jgi:hypothetical protein
MGLCDSDQTGVLFMSTTYKITFPDASIETANQYSASLRRALKDIEPGLSVEQVKDRLDTMDFGASLVLALGTASVASIARGIEFWLKRNSGVRIQISKDGEVIVTNLDSGDAARIVEALQHPK